MSTVPNDAPAPGNASNPGASFGDNPTDTNGEQGQPPAAGPTSGSGGSGSGNLGAAGAAGQGGMPGADEEAPDAGAGTGEGQSDGGL